MQKSKKAFTMIEMVFVIVILGILAAVAVPRFAATKVDAEITKGKADVATIRAAIVSERQTQLIKGDSSYISALTPTDSTILFTGNGTRTLLMYGIKASSASGGWSLSGTTYTYNAGGTTVDFTYDSSTGKFSCSTDILCDKLSY